MCNFMEEYTVFLNEQKLYCVHHLILWSGTITKTANSAKNGENTVHPVYIINTGEHILKEVKEKNSVD